MPSSTTPRKTSSRAGPRFDLVFDTVGNRALADFRKVLSPTGAYVSCTGGNLSLRWLFRLAKASLTSLFTRQKLKMFVVSPSREDLLSLKELVEAGKAKPFIERRYALSEVADALRHVGGGHTRGQVVIRIPDQPSSLTVTVFSIGPFLRATRCPSPSG